MGEDLEVTANASCWSENFATRAIFKHKVFRTLASTIGPRYVEYTIPPIRMVLDLKEEWGVSKMILKQGAYNPFVSRLMKEWIGPHGTMIDIGANIGYFSLLGARYTDGTVFAFEPEEHNFDLLSRNTRLNGCTNVKPIRKAVGNTAGTLKLYKSSGNAGDHHTYPTAEKRQATEVEVVRIDDVLHEVQNVRLIKIDVQGFEENVVRGMERILTATENVKVVSEFWPQGLWNAGSSADGYLDFMESLGFTWQILNEENETMETVNRQELLQQCSGDHAVDLLFSRA